MLERRLRHAPHRGQPEQRGRPAADRAAARARARRRGPRDGHVRRRRDPRARGDRPARDRDRDRGPAGPPVADRLARGDRGRQGRAGRGAARRPPTAASRSSTPTTSGCAGWPRARAPATTTYGFADDADVRADEVESRGLDGMAFRLLTPAGDRAVEIPALGRLAVHNALAGAAAGLAAGLSLDDDRARAGRAVARRAPLDGDPRGRRRDRRRRYNAAPALGHRRARAPGRAPGRPPDRRPGRDARAGRRARRGPPRGRTGRRRGPRRAWSSWMASPVAPPRGSWTARSPPASPAGSITAVATAEDAVLRHDDDRPARRRGAGQGVARRGARAGRRRPRRGARRPGAGPVTLELIQGLLLAFALVVILMPPYMRLLRHAGFGKQIREEGPQSHMVKWGTPTMGGLLVIIVVIVIFLVLRWPPQGGVIAPLATLAFVGLLGAADDYLNARTGEGIRARQKLLWQIGRGAGRRVPDPEHLPDHRHPGAVRGRRGDRPARLHLLRRVRDRRLVQRRQHHRRPRRPRGRDARVRVRLAS